jgi:hypothetical protein
LPRTIYFEGRIIQVPNDVSDEEMGGILSQGAPPVRAAVTSPGGASGGAPVDPRFFAPMHGTKPVASSCAGTVDPRFLTTMPTPAAGVEGGSDAGGTGAANTTARSLGMSLGYAAQQDPGHYAYLLHLQDLTGIPPIVSAGNEKQIQQMLDATRINPHYFTMIAPVTSEWASDPDNAAVAGVDEIERLGRIEQNAAAMRAVPRLTDVLNPYSNAPIPTSADDPQMQAWQRVASFWQGMGKGSPKPVDPLAAAANQALARAHAGDSAYRVAPQAEPTTIGEEAQQATTLRTLQVYAPATPTIAPLPTPAESAASVVRYPADAMAAITYSNGRPDDPALLADIQKQQAEDQEAEQNRRDADRAVVWDWLTQPINVGHLRENIAANEALIDAGPTMADVESDERSEKAPWYHPQLDMARVHQLEKFVRSFSTSAAKMFLTPLGIATAAAGPAGEGVGEAIPAATQAIRLLDGAVGMGLGAKGIYDQAHEGLTRQPGESWPDYITRTSGNAAMVLGGLTAGAHAASSAIDGLGYAQGASDGLSEGAREVMGGSPGDGAASDTNTFHADLSRAMVELAQSKLRGRAPERFQQVLRAIFQGNDNLQIPVQRFNDFFAGKSMDAAAVAREIGADNYANAAATLNGNVEVPTENFLGKLRPEDQQGLLPDVVNPASGVTLRQHRAVQRNLRQQYIDTGQTADNANAMAAQDANVYLYLARKIGLRPEELSDYHAKLRESGTTAAISSAESSLASNATEEGNAVTSSTQILPGDVRSASIAGDSPAAAARLEEQTTGSQAFPVIEPGSFSIFDWTGYPSGAPRPSGIFRLLRDPEYGATRDVANNSNRAKQRADPAAHAGKHIHHIKPVKFGGHPTDPANTILLSPSDHYQFNRWWFSLQKSIE